MDAHFVQHDRAMLCQALLWFSLNLSRIVKQPKAN
jgi:hypothetical protein